MTSNTRCTTHWAYLTPNGELIPSTIREKPGDSESALLRSGIKYRGISPKACREVRVEVSYPLLSQPMSTTNLQSDIASVRAKLEQAQNELRALEARAKQEATAQTRWEPKGGAFYLHTDGCVQECRNNTDSSSRLDGTDYPTREAAESALPYVTFFKRLCCLAQELNPSGKVGGRYYVSRNANVPQWHTRTWGGSINHVIGLFETEDAADHAAAIMTRDGWDLPAL